jgi:hypothetical protein
MPTLDLECKLSQRCVWLTGGQLCSSLKKKTEMWTKWIFLFPLFIRSSSQEYLRQESSIRDSVPPVGDEQRNQERREGDLDLDDFRQNDGSLWQWQYAIQRYLLGSNCLMIEKGRAPPYEKCYGCEIQRAMNCLSDLRRNVTGNVPSGCRLNSLNSDYDTTCCPVYVQKKSKLILRFETSGYPSALSCLRKVGCQATQVN